MTGLKKLCILTILLTALSSTGALAYEVDNFTNRDTLTADAMPVLDRKVNELLDRSVASTNKEKLGFCSRALLRQEVVRWTRPSLVSFLEVWATFTSEVQRTDIPLSKSIYSSVKPWESWGMWFVGIGRALRLNGHIVGTDKIGHFFMQGLEYFRRVTDDRRSLDEVLTTAHEEDGFYGLTGTGVKSYADMAANYAGYRFWSQLYQGANPYIRCDGKGSWKRVRDFTWADYVTVAWDEGVNCSEYLPRLAKRVEKNMNRAGIKCPVVPQSCRDIRKLEKAEFFTSPQCKG